MEIDKKWVARMKNTFMEKMTDIAADCDSDDEFIIMMAMNRMLSISSLSNSLEDTKQLWVSTGVAINKIEEPSRSVKTWLNGSPHPVYKSEEKEEEYCGEHGSAVEAMNELMSMLRKISK